MMKTQAYNNNHESFLSETVTIALFSKHESIE